MKKVSILLATYNGEKFIEQQLQSLLLNFDKVPDVSFEIFISDDGSTDSTLTILNEYIDKYPFIYLIDKNKKGGANLNFTFLIKNVKTDADYIFFCDQDDFWLPSKVEIFIKKFESQENIKQSPILLHSDLVIVNESLFPTSLSMFSANKLNKSPSFYNLLSENVVTGCACAINKNLFDLLRKCDFTYSKMHDHYIALIAHIYGRVFFIDKSTILYRQHANNVIGSDQIKLSALILNFRKVIMNIQTIKTSLKNDRNQALSLLLEKKLILPKDYEELLNDYIQSFNQSLFKRTMLVIKGIRKKSYIKNIVYDFFYIFWGKKWVMTKGDD